MSAKHLLDYDTDEDLGEATGEHLESDANSPDPDGLFHVDPDTLLPVRVRRVYVAEP